MKFLISIILILSIAFSAKIVVQEQSFDTNPILREEFIGKQADFGYLNFEDYQRNFIGEADIPQNIGRGELDGCMPYTHNAPIVVVRRGNCKFFQKAEQAISAGAQFLIIVDNEEEDVTELSLVDRTSGEHYNMGIIMIEQQQGEALINLIQTIHEREEDGHVAKLPHLVIYFDELPRKRVVYADYWYSSLTPYSYDFFSSFGRFISGIDEEELDKYIDFQVHTPVRTHPVAEKMNFQGFYNENCIQQGRYCSMDPDGDGPLNGADALEYDLKFLCMRENSSLKEFLSLSIHFHKTCLGQDYDISKKKDNKQVIDDCFKNTLTTFIRFDLLDSVEACLEDARSGNRNDYFEKQLNQYDQFNVQIWPELFVNDTPIHADLAVTEEVSAVICSAFKADRMPRELCYMYNNGYEQPTIIDEGYGYQDSRVQRIVWVIVSLAIVAVLVGLYFIRRKVMQDNSSSLQMNVHSAVDQYMMMKDSSSKLEFNQ